MTNNTTENFWEAFAIPQEPPKPIMYRLYYDDAGNPLFYTMQEEEGNYIEIDQETFVKSPTHIKVVDGKIVHTQCKQYIKKLVPSDVGTPCSPTNVCIVVNESEPHIKWSIKNYE